MTRPKAGTSRAHARDAQLADLVRAIVRLVLSEDRDAPGTHAGELSDEDRFFAERCGFGAGCKADTSALRQAYEGWCKDQGVTPLSAREFAKRLEERACEPGKSDGKRVWKGVRLLEPENPGTSEDIGADPLRPSLPEQLLAHYLSEHERITGAELTPTAHQHAQLTAFCEELLATTEDLDEAKNALSERIDRAHSQRRAKGVR